ncbi:hypothetical protein [Mesorhizobium marinum]
MKQIGIIRVGKAATPTIGLDRPATRDEASNAAAGASCAGATTIKARRSW